MERGLKGSRRGNEQARNVQWIWTFRGEAFSVISFLPVLRVRRSEFFSLKTLDVPADCVVHGDYSKEFAV